MKTDYDVTIGYRAVVVVNIKATNETEAKEKALELFKKEKNKFYNKVQLQDDNFAVQGILNMDETWGML